MTGDMNRIQVTEYAARIESLIHQWGGGLFGVTDLLTFQKEDLLLSPELVEKHPVALSIGYHLSDAILEDIEDRPTPLYFQHYQRVNILLDTLGLVITNVLQDLGYRAVPIPASQLVDW